MSGKIAVYYYMKSGILEGKLNCVVGQETHVLTEEELEKDPAKKELYKDTLIWEGETPLMAGYPLPDENKPGYIRLATRKELIDMGLDSLKDGEIIQGDEIVKVDQPNEFAKWNKELGKWETNFEELPDGWKIVDRELQKLEFIESPNYHAKWNKETQEWETNKEDLLDGEKLLEDGKIENVEKPEDDDEHKWTWSKDTFTYENTITPEELKSNYHKIVEQLKLQCLEEGFMFRGYQQKCRTQDITWLNCRLIETKNEAVAKNQINEKYELLVDRSELGKVGWVFDHNEVLMLDVIDFKEMFDMGSSWTQACYAAEEVLKSLKEFNMNVSIGDYRLVVAKFTEVESFNMPKPVTLRSRSRRSLARSVSDEHQPGHYSNPCHELGLNGADVMIATYLNIPLEEYVKVKQQYKNDNNIPNVLNK